MAKTPTKTKKTKAPPPTSLTLRLDAPGMSAMHRAGLGGLAATLFVLDKIRAAAEKAGVDFRKRKPFNDELWDDDFSWSVDSKTIVLRWGTPEKAKRFFKWLFKFAFQLDADGLIFLPGQYPIEENGAQKVPPSEVRARLQQGATLTFLQHGQTRKLGEKKETSYEYGDKKIEFSYKPCLSYTHANAWEDWIDEKKGGVLNDQKEYVVQGPIYPGAIVRHQAFGATAISQPISAALPLVFALVGTLSLPINGGVGVLIVPRVDDLVKFASKRGGMTPSKIQKTFIVGSSDAALQFAVRRFALESATTSKVPGCDAIQFRPLPWSTQQKSRCDAESVEKIGRKLRDAYGRVLAIFDPNLKTTTTSKKIGKGKNAVVEEKEENFWSVSIVLRLIADNMLAGKLWCDGFARFANSADPATGKPLFNKIALFERKKLNKMINDEKIEWKPEGSKELVLAVQEALSSQYSNIYKLQNIGENARKNKLNDEYEKWRLAFSNAKTPAQFRYPLADMFSRAKSVPTLRENLPAIMSLVGADWELARDLALVALAGYKGKGKDDENDDAQNGVGE